ncbi:MAG: transglutaminase-like cysteine peptidase [Oleiphilaceae bacterium]|nr:transglutaminase-like cysteine peptidase [Oleiphilaceae bacterium]
MYPASACFVQRFPQWFLLLFLATSVASLELGQTLLNVVRDRFGDDAVQRLQQWEKIANSSHSIKESQKLELVNRFFNRTRFISDFEHWGKEDYWATPVELLATNGGDCEDYSIAKYFTLKELGVSVDKLKITYVKALKLNQAHMVLAYYPEPGAEPLILDNLVNDIKPASERDDLVPVYSFNGEGLWLSKLRGQEGKRIGTPDKLDHWQDLMIRHNKLLPQ